MGPSDITLMHGLTESGKVSWVTETTFCRWIPGHGMDVAGIPGGDDNPTVAVLGGINESGNVVGGYYISEDDETNNPDGYAYLIAPVYWAAGSPSLGQPNYDAFSTDEGAYAEVFAITNANVLYGAAEVNGADDPGWSAATWSSPTASPASSGYYVEYYKNGHYLAYDDAWNLYVDGAPVDSDAVEINSSGHVLTSSSVCTVGDGTEDADIITDAYAAYDMNAAQLPHHSGGTTTMVECPQVIGVDDDFDYAVFQKNPDTGDYSDTKLDTAVASGSGFTSIGPVEINNEGMISAIGYDAGLNMHALLLAPIQVVQSNFPTSLGAEDDGPTAAQNIIGPGGNGVAFITGSPAMPQLTAKIGNFTDSGMTVDWRLHVTSERAERGSKDDIDIPWNTGSEGIPVGGPDYVKTLPINEAWNMFDPTDSSYPFAPYDIFGGKVILYFTIEIRTV